MARIKAVLLENLRTEATHEESGDVVISDGPVVVGGVGEKMGPTEMVAAALGNCILMMMGIEAAKLGIDLSGATANVRKELVYQPVMRIGLLEVVVRVPIRPTDEQMRRLEQAARTCPVHHSLGSEVNEVLKFEWGAP